MTKPIPSLVAMLLLSLAGCAQLKVPGAEYLSASKEYFDLSKDIPWGAGDHEPGKPTRVVTVWADTVMYTAGKTPVRGFGGRLMFYTAKGEKPVKIDGDLVIYAFDELGRDPRRIAPDKKFVFPADQVPRHYSKGELGHSYSVWLPWDEAGGTQKEISLIVRFIPKNGSVLVGEQTRHLLPGAKLDETQLAAPGANMPGGPHPSEMQPLPAPQASPAPASGGVEQASHAWGSDGAGDCGAGVPPAGQPTGVHAGGTPAPQSGDARKKMSTTTIDMSSRYGRPSPTSATAAQRPASGQEFSVAPGVETTVHYGPPPRTAGQAAPSAAPLAASAVGSGVANASTLGRPGSMRPRNMGSPIERPVRERTAWGRPATVVNAVPSGGY